MPATPGEVYFLNDDAARLRDSESARYVLVLRLDGAHAQIAYFSSRFDLFRPGVDIGIYKEWEEFRSAGLTMDCFLVTDPLGRTKLSNLTDRRGKIEGSFKKAVEDWWGEPF